MMNSLRVLTGVFLITGALYYGSFEALKEPKAPLVAHNTVQPLALPTMLDRKPSKKTMKASFNPKLNNEQSIEMSRWIF